MINPFGENQVITKFGDEFVTTIWGKTGHQIGHQFWWQIGWPDCKIWWEIWWEIWWVTKWGDEFVTRFGDQLSESPNLVTNLSPNFWLLPRWSYMKYVNSNIEYTTICVLCVNLNINCVLNKSCYPFFGQNSQAICIVFTQLTKFYATAGRSGRAKYQLCGIRHRSMQRKSPLLVVHPVNKAATEAAPTLGLNW